MPEAQQHLYAAVAAFAALSGRKILTPEEEEKKRAEELRAAGLKIRPGTK